MRLAFLLLIFALAPGESQSATLFAGAVNVRSFGAKGDGRTDDFAALEGTIEASAKTGRQILLPAGTYTISRPLVIPNKTQLFGVGRGDPGINTVIKALPNFPPAGAVVTLGDVNPSFGVRVENLTIDGSGIAATCLENRVSEEQSAGRDLLLTNCTRDPLLVAGGGAQNSGPFEDLEIYPGPARATTVCVRIENVIGFRGIRGLTCNAGDKQKRPNVAMALDGGGLYSDIHVEHFATALSLGSAVTSADSMTIINGQFGPDVDTGISINPRPGNQNITVIGMSCVGCRRLLFDGIKGVTDDHTSLGMYALGDGTGSSKPVIANAQGVHTHR